MLETRGHKGGRTARFTRFVAVKDFEFSRLLWAPGSPRQGKNRNQSGRIREQGIVLAGAHQHLGLRQLPNAFKLDREFNCRALDILLASVVPDTMSLWLCLASTSQICASASSTRGSDQCRRT